MTRSSEQPMESWMFSLKSEPDLVCQNQQLKKIINWDTWSAEDLKIPQRFHIITSGLVPWYFLSIYFVIRGLKFHHQLNLESFVFHMDETGKSATLQHEKLQKNHQGCVDANGSHIDKRMSCLSVKVIGVKTDQNTTNIFNLYIKEILHLSDIW